MFVAVVSTMAKNITSFIDLGVFISAHIDWECLFLLIFLFVSITLILVHRGFALTCLAHSRAPPPPSLSRPLWLTSELFRSLIREALFVKVQTRYHYKQLLAYWLLGILNLSFHSFITYDLSERSLVYW